MSRTFLSFCLIAGLLLLAGCSSGNNKKNAANATPIRTATPTASPTPLAATPALSPSPAGTPFPATTGGATTFPALGTTTRTPTGTAPASAPATTTVGPTPSAATPPSAPPPPPPIPTGTARGGRDSSGATLPVGDLCPLGYPVKGADNLKAYRAADPEYATVRPVACFQTPDDAVTAGYTLAHG